MLDFGDTSRGSGDFGADSCDYDDIGKDSCDSGQDSDDFGEDFVESGDSSDFVKSFHGFLILARSLSFLCSYTSLRGIICFVVASPPVLIAWFALRKTSRLEFSLFM